MFARQTSPRVKRSESYTEDNRRICCLSKLDQGSFATAPLKMTLGLSGKATFSLGFVLVSWID